MNSRLYHQPTTVEVSQRLRTLRISRGLSLRNVQEATKGRITAAALGSYERSDRALTLEKMLELATHYHVPVDFLLSDTSDRSLTQNEEIVTFDLRSIRGKSTTPLAPQVPLVLQPEAREEDLIHFLGFIAAKRSDWNGEILTVRKGDMPTLAILLRIPEVQVVPWLSERRFLFNRN